MKTTIIKVHNKPVIQITPETDMDKLILDDMFTDNIADTAMRSKKGILSVVKSADKRVTSITVGQKTPLTNDAMALAGFLDQTNPTFMDESWDSDSFLFNHFRVFVKSKTILAVGRGTFKIFKTKSGSSLDTMSAWPLRIKSRSSASVVIDKQIPDWFTIVEYLGTASTLEELQGLINKTL